jgi:hypothetical protein
VETVGGAGVLLTPPPPPPPQAASSRPLATAAVLSSPAFVPRIHPALL